MVLRSDARAELLLERGCNRAVDAAIDAEDGDPANCFLCDGHDRCPEQAGLRIMPRRASASIGSVMTTARGVRSLVSTIHSMTRAAMTASSGLRRASGRW